MGHGPRPDTVWLRQFETKLSELSIVIDKLRKMAVKAHELGLPEPTQPQSKEQPNGVENESLLDTMEKEIAIRRSSAAACEEESSMPKRACKVCGKDAVK